MRLSYPQQDVRWTWPQRIVSSLVENERPVHGSNGAEHLDHCAAGPVTTVTMSGEGCLKNQRKREASLCRMDS